MKKRELKLEILNAVGYEPGDEDDDATGARHLINVIARRVDDLHHMREIAGRVQRRAEAAVAAARLWKRAAKAWKLSPTANCHGLPVNGKRNEG